MAAKSNFGSMVIVLTLTCLICSALLAGVYALTAKPIADTNSRNLKASIAAVLPEGVEISDGMEIEVGGQKSVYYVASKDGETVAYAIQSTTTGFGGALTLMVGLQPDGVVYNTSVLSHSETPGLGAKCTTDKKFMDQWKGFDTSSKILSVKKDGGDVDAITASTITSRAYTLAVKNAAQALKTIGGQTND
jgi:electron transport complex protein RnfG